MSESIEEKKQDLREHLVLLKQDVETAKQMIQYIEDNIDFVATEEDVKNFNANINAFEEKLEVLEIF